MSVLRPEWRNDKLHSRSLNIFFEISRKTLCKNIAQASLMKVSLFQKGCGFKTEGS